MFGPYLRSRTTISSAMTDVCLALTPAALLAIYFYGVRAVVLLTMCTLTALGTETMLHRKQGKKTPMDRSIIVTGLLLALCLRPTTPVLTAVVAAVIAAVSKNVTGGLGKNRLNPALVGRVSITLLAPILDPVNRLLAPLIIQGPDSLTGATPLALLKSGEALPNYWKLFFGYPGGGALAEASAVMLLLGGVFLIYKKHITLHTPLSVVGTAAIVVTALGRDFSYHLLTGGLLLGSIYMATDWTTSPISSRGRVVAGCLVGAMVAVFRILLPTTEGVAFSILLMNTAVPLIERATRRATFGRGLSAQPVTVVPQEQRHKTSS